MYARRGGVARQSWYWTGTIARARAGTRVGATGANWC